MLHGVLFAVLVVSCATAPSRDTPDTQMPDTQMPDNESEVIVRSRRSGELFVDGNSAGLIEVGTPSTISLSPGAHVISVAPAKDAEEFIRITVEAGERRELQFRFGDDDSRLIEPEALTGTMVLRLPRGVYRGEVRDGEPHGSGSLTSDEGDRYEGHWRDGLRHGQGTMEWADGSSYIGKFQEGEFHGEGEYIWSDGARYYGEWRGGDRHGVGYMEWSDGDYYEGEWRDDEPEGSGLIIWNDGSRYEGDWVNGDPEGFGFYTEPDELRYEGAFEAGLAVGGVLTVPTGEQYWATMSESGEWEWEYPIDENSEDAAQ